MELSLPGLEIDEKISEGPLRVVFRARQVPLGRRVRLVTLAPGIAADSPLAASLNREARALSTLDHPNVLRLFEFGKTEGSLWLVLEDLDGAPLSERFAPPVAWKIAASVGVLIARALAHAHARGVVHGLLGASSVLVGKDGSVKVEGFGLAPEGTPDEVEPLEPVASGALPPEGLLGAPASPLGDVFGLGALLYELTTGVPPFGPPNHVDYLARVRKEAPAPLTTYAPDVSSTFDALVLWCLAQVPAERPEGMLEIEQRLRALLPAEPEAILAGALAGEGVPARPSSPPRISWLSPWTRPSGLRLLVWVAAAFFAGGLAWAAATTLEKKSLPRPTQVTLAPHEALSLKVVVTPWAHVLVDGERLETTPFARPLLLTPGAHVVRFEHPQAAPEERAIRGEAGQTVYLDVALRIERPPLPAAPLGPPVDDSP